MNNNNKKEYYNNRRNKRKNFSYYCPNSKPFFYHKKHKKDNNDSNILLDDKVQEESIIEPINKVVEEPVIEPVNKVVEEPVIEPVNKVAEENHVEQVDIVPEKKQEEVVVPKPPIIKMALGIVILVAVVFGMAFAYFNFYYVDTRQADISSAEVYVRVLENTASITLNKTYPRTATEARAKNDNYVDFTVEGKNTSTNKELYYTLNINDGDAIGNKTRIARNNIKVDLQEKINGAYTYIAQAVSLSSFSFEGVVPVNTTSVLTREFRLRIWMSEDVLISDTDPNRTYTQSQFHNLFASYNIEVSAADRATSAQEISVLLSDTNAAGNKIYTGSSPANYVTFNDESWRIIGVYDGKLKIVRSSPLTDTQKWQNSQSDGNTWDGSLLETYLNTTYYNSLSNGAKAMIAEGSWNVGACSYTTASSAYTCAHTTTLTGQDTDSNRVKVGLIALYEYLYAAENDGTCWTTSASNYNSSCRAKNWLYAALTTTNNGTSIAWTISPYSRDSGYAFIASPSVAISSSSVEVDFAISPVVYLNSSVRITGGDGESPQTAYTLSYT